MNSKLTFSEKLFLIRTIGYSILAAFISSQYTISFFKLIMYMYTEILVGIYYPDTKPTMYN